MSRKDPAAANGTVTVDVSLTGELPRGAVPDLSVDGTVQLERLDNILYVGRPSLGQDDSTVGLFKLTSLRRCGASAGAIGKEFRECDRGEVGTE